MSEPVDLTRWNRAGLSSFRYVDGNAVEYLELLRQKLAVQFADPDSGLCEWLNPSELVPENELEDESETLVERQQRLSRRQQRILETYHQDRRDWAWEISRTFARSCHILTEYANAYANEGFLNTATQWEHVRRLVEMLDYHPAPPASAYTWLSFTATEGKSGAILKGFQVKNSPATGGDKVIFETLEDFNIDASLNALRPQGWDVSEEAFVSGGESEEQLYSYVSLRPAIDLQGVGPVYAAKLDSLVGSDGFRIRDFQSLNPDSSGTDINVTKLWEARAKADFLVNFSPEGNWSTIDGWLLPEIVNTSAESLVGLSGNSLELATQLKMDIELVEVCLDHDVFTATYFSELFSLRPDITEWIETRWIKPSKPEVVAEAFAMIMDETNDLAEAVSIDRVEETGEDNEVLVIDLLPDTLQFKWMDWQKGNTALYYASRWRKKCWINGDDVIRTKEAHGLSKNAIVCWKLGALWKFARVIEADKRNLRLELTGPLPGPDTELQEAVSITTQTMGADLEAVGMFVGDAPAIIDLAFGDSVGPAVPEVGTPFTINPPAPGSLPDPLAPPGGLSFGSFLFPTPMLPMDLVKVAVDLMLSMGVMVIPSTGEIVFKSLDAIAMPSAADMVNLLDIIENLTWDAGIDTPTEKEIAVQAMLDSLPEPPTEDPDIQFQEILAEIEADNPLIAVNKNAVVKAVVDSSIPTYVVEEPIGKIRTGDWIIGEFTDGARALKVDQVQQLASVEQDDSFSLSFDNLHGNPGDLLQVYADYRGRLVPENASFNETGIDSDEIMLESMPESLKVCRYVLLTATGKEPVLAKIIKIVGNSLITDPPITGFSKGELVIDANIALVGHGESKPEKIIGSGDATQSHQVFTLEVDEVSFVPDATMSAGVAAALDVIVDGRVWEQVSTLKDSIADDHHYAVRMTEAGHVKLLFGDGKYGRRLPSGKNNVRARYRVGSGIVGNLVAGSLEKPVNPHPLVESVKQWQPAAGGGDMESLTSLRENAPPSLLALERAVSLSDFAHLSTSQSGIWQARAYNEVLHGGRIEIVKVIIVPAGGVKADETKKELTRFLQQHSLPGVQVLVGDFISRLFDLTVTIRVDSDAYILSEIEDAVEIALIDHFTLSRRKLGEQLYLSEIYKIVEAVEGVENSICVLDESEQLKVIKAENLSTVIYLDTDADSNLLVNAEAYQP